MNDPTNWDVDAEVGSFAFANNEEAKKAEAVMNKALRESFENGRKVAFEQAARFMDDQDVENATMYGAAIRAMKDTAP